LNEEDLKFMNNYNGGKIGVDKVGFWEIATRNDGT